MHCYLDVENLRVESGSNMPQKKNKCMNSLFFVSPEKAHTAQWVERQLDPEPTGPTLALIILESDKEGNRS